MPPHFKCCVCGISDRADETHLPKRARKLPLVPRPEVLLIEFATQHTTVCRICARANDRRIADARQVESLFVPQKAFDLLRQGSVDMAKLIVRTLPPMRVVHHRDAVSGGNALHLAAKGGYFQMARFLLFRRRTRKWATVHPDYEQNRDNNSTLTPSMMAKTMTHNPAINSDGNHLYAANNSTWRDPDEDRELLAVTNTHGLTPLGVASATSGRADFVRLFLDAGADPHFVHRTEHDTTTLIMLCCVSGQTRAIQELQRHGARVNDRSPKDGRTALMVASSLAQVEVVKTLLACGARPEMVDHTGLSALDRASKRTVLDPAYGSICAILVHALGGAAAEHLVQGPHPSSGCRAGKSSVASSRSLANLSEARKLSMSSSHAKFGYQARRKRLFAKKWQEYYDSLSEAPYWWHPDTEETTWELPEFVMPSEWTRRWLEKDKARQQKAAARAEMEHHEKQQQKLGVSPQEKWKEGGGGDRAGEEAEEDNKEPLLDTEPSALRTPTTTVNGTTFGTAMLSAAAADRLSPEAEMNVAAAASQHTLTAAVAHEKKFLKLAESEAFRREFEGHYKRVKTQVAASAAQERREQQAEIEARNLRMQQAAVASTGTVISSDWRAQRSAVLCASKEKKKQQGLSMCMNDGKVPQLQEVFPEIPLRVRERRRMPNPELDYKDGLLTAVVRTKRNKRRQTRIVETRRVKEMLTPALARAATIKAAEDAAKKAAKTVLIYGPRSAKAMLETKPVPPTTFSSGDPRNTGTMTRTEEEATDGIEFADAELRRDSDFDLPRDFVEGGNTLFLPEEGVVEVSVWPGEYKRGGMGELSGAAGGKVVQRGEGEGEGGRGEVVTIDFRDTRLYSKRAGRYVTQAEEMVSTMMSRAVVSGRRALPPLSPSH